MGMKATVPVLGDIGIYFALNEHLCLDGFILCY